MKTSVKVIGIAALALSLLSFKVYKDYSTVIEKMTFFMSKIRNLRMRNGKFFFNFDLVLHNPTDIDFSFDTAGFIKVKQIDVFYEDKLLGRAFSDATKIELPAKSYFRITDIEVEVIPLGLLGSLSTIIEDQSKFRAQVTIDALGTTYIVDQPFVF